MPRLVHLKKEKCSQRTYSTQRQPVHEDVPREVAKVRAMVEDRMKTLKLLGRIIL